MHTTNTHAVLGTVLTAAVAACYILTTLPPSKKVWWGLCCGLLTAQLSTCVVMKVYQSCEAPPGSHRAELCYKGSWVYICTLRQCDVSKYTQQAHTLTARTTKKKKTKQKKLPRLHSQQNSPWNGMDGLLFPSLVSQCAHLSLCTWMKVKCTRAYARLCLSIRETKPGKSLLHSFRGDGALKRMLFTADE